MKNMEGWNVIGYYGAGTESVVYKVESKDNGYIAAMKIIETNELITTFALIDLSIRYPWYIRIINYEFHKTDPKKSYIDYLNWEDTGIMINTIGKDDYCESCHCIYESLDNRIETTREILIHLLVAVYIAMDSIGYCTHNFQFMIRKTAHNDPIVVNYKHHKWVLPNPGYVPVIMDHGHSDIYGKNTERHLYDILSYYYHHDAIPQEEMVI